MGLIPSAGVFLSFSFRHSHSYCRYRENMKLGWFVLACLLGLALSRPSANKGKLMKTATKLQKHSDAETVEHFNYGNNEDEIWTFTAHDSFFGKMNVEFNSFDIVEHRDYVYIYDGADTDAELLAEYSGTTLPDSVSSTGGSITVRFTSYKTHSFFNGDGFSFTVTEFRGKKTTGEAKKTSGKLTKTFGKKILGGIEETVEHFNYGNNEDELWTFTAHDSHNVLTVEFTVFYTEYGYDKVFVYDGLDINAPQLYEPLTGNIDAPAVRTSTGSSITVRFTSDFSETRTGFSFTVSERESQGPLPLLSDSVDHLNYGNGEHEIWSYSANNPSNHLTISFTAFDTEFLFDKVEIFDGPSGIDRRLHQYTGTGYLPEDVTSSGPSICVRFMSDDETTAGGFSFTVNEVASKKTLGKITS